jgi:hypothetical protein
MQKEDEKMIEKEEIIRSLIKRNGDRKNSHVRSGKVKRIRLIIGLSELNLG